MNDLDIAKKVKLQHISHIAQKFGVSEDEIEMYGKYKAGIHPGKGRGERFLFLHYY